MNRVDVALSVAAVAVFVVASVSVAGWPVGWLLAALAVGLGGDQIAREVLWRRAFSKAEAEIDRIRREVLEVGTDIAEVAEELHELSVELRKVSEDLTGLNEKGMEL